MCIFTNDFYNSRSAKGSKIENQRGLCYVMLPLGHSLTTLIIRSLLTHPDEVVEGALTFSSSSSSARGSTCNAESIAERETPAAAEGRRKAK